jgi:hypothetical protein
MRRLSELHEDPENVRLHPPRNRQAVKDSLAVEDIEVGELEEEGSGGAWMPPQDESQNRRAPTVTLTVRVPEANVIERALSAAMTTGAPTRGDALAMVCREWMDHDKT